MGKINFGRVLLGGIVAGIIIDAFSYVVDGLILKSQWAAANQGNFTTNQIVGFCILGLIAGMMIIWFYAACKPRLGTRYRTALNVGLAAWILGYVLPNAGYMYIAQHQHNLMIYTTLGNLVEVLVGTFVGAALYKESAVLEAAPKPAAV